jgi:hypothetical protein
MITTTALLQNPLSEECFLAPVGAGGAQLAYHVQMKLTGKKTSWHLLLPLCGSTSACNPPL